MLLRRVLQVFTAVALALPVALSGAAGTASADAPTSKQLLFFNHGYGVVDRETADAIEHSTYLKEFASFFVRTTTGAGGQTWTGRYLMGRETYFELFGVGDLPGKDGTLGMTGFGISSENQGDMAKARQRLVDQGIKPVDFQQVRDFGDGTPPLPWFDAIFTDPDQYDSLNAWGMEYRQEYLNDPRTKIRPASYPGDVSRDRYLNDDYQKHLMRDISSVRLAITQRDLNVTLPLIKAGGFVVTPIPGGVLAVRGGTTMRLDAVPQAEIGLRQVEFTLNRPVASQPPRQIGNSTLTVGPGARAVWNFQR